MYRVALAVAFTFCFQKEKKPEVDHENEKEEIGEEARDRWELVEDESGKKGLSLITKTSNSIVIKPYNVTSGTANTDESNENSSSRLNDTENENLITKSSDDHSKDEEMDLPPSFTDDIVSLEDVLGLSKNSVKSPKYEAEIQKIKHNLASDFEGTKSSPNRGSVCGSNGSQIQQSPVSFPNTRFTHQMPQTILNTSSAAVPLLSTTSVSSSLTSPTMLSKLADYGDGDNEEGTKVSIKVMKPGELNNKATEGVSKMCEVSTVQQITAINPSKILLQNPAFSPAVQQNIQLQSSQLSAGGQLGARLQSPQSPAVLRISALNRVVGIVSGEESDGL